MKKRFLSILLSLCMVLALFPVTAFAEDNEEPTVTPVCTCEAACAAEAMNADCPICGAEGATIENCGKYEAPVEETEPEQTAVEKVQALIDALPTVEELEAAEEATVNAAYEAAQDAYDALEALNPEEQEQITGAEKLVVLMDWFNGQVSPLDGEATLLTSNSDGQLLCNGVAVNTTSLTIDVQEEAEKAGHFFSESIEGYVLEGGTYKLDSNVTLNASVIIKGGTADSPVTLDLCGHVLKYENSAKSNSVIVVYNDTYFTLTDTAPTADNGYSYTAGPDAGDFTLYTPGMTDTGATKITGGIITGGTGTSINEGTEYDGGGVFVGCRATFTMTGGSIVGCTANGTGNGGGVYVAQGQSGKNPINTTFHMTGGSIVGCKASSHGGGVSAASGSRFHMTDSRIIGCTASSSGGGISNHGTAYMTDSTISQCTGGGISNEVAFEMEDSSITGCVAPMGGGVSNSYGTFLMKNGSIISGCVATADYNAASSNGGGGGVYLNHGRFTMEEGSTIFDCTAEPDCGDSIYVFEGALDAKGGSVNGVAIINDEITNSSMIGSALFYDGVEKNKSGYGRIAGKLATFMDGDSMYAQTLAGTTIDQTTGYTCGGGKITLPTLTRDGYAFTGWYKDSACTEKWDPTKTDGGNDASFNITGLGNQDFGTCTLYAGWTPIDYTITYYYGLPDDVAAPTNPTTYTVESTDITLTAPTWDLHSFLGWTYEGQTEPVLSVTIPTGSTGDRTYTANWKELYTVTFDPNGGTVDPTSATTDAYGKLTELPTPTRSGSYRFDGWFTEKNGGTAVTVDTVFTAHTTVYAHWTYTGGSSRPSYAITVPDTEHGTVKVSPRYAERGDTVTITVTPDSGYTLETLTVLDKNGKEIELTDKGDGKYTFKMPSGKVEVKATFAEDNSMLNFFVDVTADKYYYNAVLWAAKNGITGGIDENHFGPDLSCTRAQLVTFLWRAAGCPVVNYAMDFSDVGDSYYTEAVRWAASLGIVGGYGNGLFGSDDAITREQFVTILYRFAVAMGYDVSVGEDTNILSYNDALDISEYAFSAMQWACGESILNGSDGNLMPQGNATRAQVAAILHRFCENILK